MQSAGWQEVHAACKQTCATYPQGAFPEEMEEEDRYEEEPANPGSPGKGNCSFWLAVMSGCGYVCATTGDM